MYTYTLVKCSPPPLRGRNFETTCFVASCMCSEVLTILGLPRGPFSPAPGVVDSKPGITMELSAGSKPFFYADTLVIYRVCGMWWRNQIVSK